ncbi:MAG: hypothetical protein PHF37_05930 [Phycisphaerae bacterium]|nr:hypothetical protein [Phycisphaerae bacterium]
MGYSRGRKALYEVINKEKPKTVFQTEEEQKPQTPPPQPSASSGWPKKQALVRYNRGRIELSVPYQIAIAAGLVVILLLMVVFRLGQNSAGRNQTASVGAVSVPKQDAKKTTSPVQFAPREPVVRQTPASAPVGQGDNVIVIVEYKDKKDLVPVQQHFASVGIATEILGNPGKFFLVTKQRYESVKLGDAALKKIAEVGAKYKGLAPVGCETFAPHYFSDAYGRKVNSF